MKELLTPKQVAKAIGVSESSLKRWCDKGVIPIVRTAGGHRRLPLSGVLAFLQRSGHELADPSVLGLPSSVGRGERTLDRAAEQLVQGLIAGHENVCRQVLFDLFIAGRSLSAIGDDVISPAFERIGDLWDCGDVEVYQERRSCEICLHVLSELRTAVLAPDEHAPLAMGGTPEGDFYQLPTALIELVLRQGGWRAVSLGSSLPAATLSAAIRTHRPRLFWLSASHVADEAALVACVHSVYESAAEVGTALAVGGRSLTESLRKRLVYATHCDTLRQLEAFAATLHRPLPEVRPVPPVIS